MIDMVVPAIMVGGSGTRLWPLSRPNKPKQFLVLDGKNSMFQETILRVEASGFSRPWLLANDDALMHINSQLAETGIAPAGVIVEPVQRGTAAAVAAIAQLIGGNNPDAIILVMPADHLISKPDLFREAVLRSVPLAKLGKIVTFGIVPTAPETGYGYIRQGEPLHVENQPVGFEVAYPGGFLEKPDLATAQKFIEQGYLWNAGIFLFKASTMLIEFQNHAMETLLAVSSAISSETQMSRAGITYHYLSTKDFAKVPNDLPIDTAIMEQSLNVAVMPCGTIGWHDVGSLSSLWEIAEKCEHGNAVIGSGFAHNSTGLLIYSAGGRKIVGSHLQDLMIVDTSDALIVIPRSRAQEVKHVVDALKSSCELEVSDTRNVTMPWGEIQQITNNGKVVVALLNFAAETTFDRSSIATVTETWTVANGEIEFIRANHAFVLGEGKSISFDDGTTVAITACKFPASCVVVCKLPPEPLSLTEIFSSKIQADEIALRVA